MYEAAFGLKQKPFSLTPDPRFSMMGGQFSRAFNLLAHGVGSGEGFSLLTGEVGCGKTTMLRCVIDKANEAYTFGFLFDTAPGEVDLLTRILFSLGIEAESTSRAHLQKQLTDFLVAEYAEGRHVVLIVDEAQNLSDQALEELRVLSNINNGQYHLLHIVLSGQPELRQRLSAPRHKQIAQRISQAFHLLPLSLAQTARYIKHRMNVAGASKAAFSREACVLIHQSSQGVPRLINQLCDTGLVYAYALKQNLVTQSTIKLVIKDNLSAWTASPHDGLAQTVTDERDQGQRVSLTEGAGVAGTHAPVNGRADNETLVRGLSLLAADVLFRERFGLPAKTRLHDMEWINIVDPCDRDRVKRIFCHYLEIGEDHFEFAATVRNRWQEPREARLSFAHKPEGEAGQYALTTAFYDDGLRLL